MYLSLLPFIFPGYHVSSSAAMNHMLPPFVICCHNISTIEPALTDISDESVNGFLASGSSGISSLYRTVFHCIVFVFHCTTLCFTALCLCFTAPHCVSLHCVCVSLHYTVFHCIVLVFHCTALFTSLHYWLHCTVCWRYFTALHWVYISLFCRCQCMHSSLCRISSSSQYFFALHKFFRRLNCISCTSCCTSLPVPQNTTTHTTAGFSWCRKQCGT